MDNLTFVAEIVKALAWPLSLLSIIFLMRKRLLRIIDRITSIKHGDTEFSFRDELGEVQEKAAEAGVTFGRPLSSLSGPLLELASKSPTSAIIEAWKSVESALKALAERASMPIRPVTRLISDLSRRGFLGNDLDELLQYLRRLRNKAVHEPSGAVTEGEAIEFIMLSRSVTERLTQIEVPPRESF